MALAVARPGEVPSKPQDYVEPSDAELAMSLFRPHLPADGTALRRVYLRLALKYHPDKKQEKDRPAATRLFQAIAKVYEDLSKGDDDARSSQRMRTRVRSPMAAAAELGDLAELRKLLEDFPEKVNEPDSLGVYPLMFAAIGGSIAAAEMLLEQGADLQAQNKINWSVVLYAALADHADMVRFLVKRGAVVTEHELILTAFTGNSNSFRVLLENYIGDPGAIRTRDGDKTLLHLACEGMFHLKRAANQHADCVKLLLDAGVPVNAAAKEAGRTCLQSYVADVRWHSQRFESSSHHMEVLEQLCLHGASVTMEDEAGATALSLAAEAGLWKVRNVLLAHGDLGSSVA